MMRSALGGALLLAMVFGASKFVWPQVSDPMQLPDAPQPQPEALVALHMEELTESDSGSEGQSQTPLPAQSQPSSQKPPSGSTTRQNRKNNITPGFPPLHSTSPGRTSIPRASRVGIPSLDYQCLPASSSLADEYMCCDPQANPFSRFLDTSPLWPLTPKQKLDLAWKNVKDPFNLLTIAALSAYSIGTDAHSAYGPGMKGFGKYAGVSLTQDATSEFFGTFLIPSLAHQDPHYYRRPNLSAKRRILHVLGAVVIGTGDDGQPMFNYATVFGTIGSSALGNLYVPGRRNNWGASVARVGTALATDPIGNAITEFLPDVSRHININVVILQRVINRVAVEEGAAPSAP